MPKFEAGKFDVIVVGAGHAGVEAALVSCQDGCINACSNNES